MTTTAYDEQENFVTLTEQGNFGLGVGNVTEKEEKKYVSDQLRNTNKDYEAYKPNK